MKALELKLPPVPLGLATAAGMWLLPAWTATSFDFPGRTILAVALGAMGIGFAGAGVAAFRRAGTTPNPMRPENAVALVTGGPYRYSRNPMYAGLLVALAGWGLHLGNGLAFAFLPLFVTYLNRFQIEPEEEALAAKFGETFDHYKRTVRRWM